MKSIKKQPKKVVILAGGLGTRLSEETTVKPKPMAEIGGKPILWHIMKIFSHYGFNEFVICCGYKGHVIKEYFANYALYNSDVSFDFAKGSMEIHRNNAENWKVTLVDTGADSLTGGRIKRIKDYVEDQTFLLTYGDGVSDIDIKKLVKFHKAHGKLATVTAVLPPGRFGAFSMKKGQTRIDSFREKDDKDVAWINGGFFVLEPGIFDYIEGDLTTWEQEPMKKLAKDKHLFAYKHKGFWHPMDTLRDKHGLEKMWDKGEAPWKVWEK